MQVVVVRYPLHWRCRDSSVREPACVGAFAHAVTVVRDSHRCRHDRESQRKSMRGSTIY